MHANVKRLEKRAAEAEAGASKAQAQEATVTERLGRLLSTLDNHGVTEDGLDNAFLGHDHLTTHGITRKGFQDILEEYHLLREHGIVQRDQLLSLIDAHRCLVKQGIEPHELDDMVQCRRIMEKYEMSTHDLSQLLETHTASSSASKITSSERQQEKRFAEPLQNRRQGSTPRQDQDKDQQGQHHQHQHQDQDIKSNQAKASAEQGRDDDEDAKAGPQPDSSSSSTQAAPPQARVEAAACTPPDAEQWKENPGGCAAISLFDAKKVHEAWETAWARRQRTYCAEQREQTERLHSYRLEIERLHEAMTAQKKDLITQALLEQA